MSNCTVFIGTAFRSGKRIARAAILLGLLPAGCASMSNTDKGVLIGGGTGATVGGIIGHASGNTGAGAVLGGIFGAIFGGAIGNAKDEKDAARAAARRAVHLNDVVSMTQQHISDGVIIGQIRSSGTVYHLSADQILYLKQNGVSDLVIGEMQATAYHYPRRYYMAEPPPIGVGIGFSGRFH